MCAETYKLGEWLNDKHFKAFQVPCRSQRQKKCECLFASKTCECLFAIKT